MKKQLQRLRRGQAMVEYTLVAHAVLLGGTMLIWPFMTYLLRGLSIYFKSIFFVLNAPTP